MKILESKQLKDKDAVKSKCRSSNTEKPVTKATKLITETSMEKIESPPSNYTRIGVEAKKWLRENPKLTRTLEKKLEETNLPILRKINAFEKSRTPKYRPQRNALQIMSQSLSYQC